MTTSITLLFTDQVRSAKEGNVFTGVCPVHGGGGEGKEGGRGRSTLGLTPLFPQGPITVNNPPLDQKLLTFPLVPRTVDISNPKLRTMVIVVEAAFPI